jgi:hypothetical protein
MPRGIGGPGDLCLSGGGSTPARSDGGAHYAHCVLCLTQSVGDTAPPPRAGGVLRSTPAYAAAVEGTHLRHPAALRWRMPAPRGPPSIAV